MEIIDHMPRDQSAVGLRIQILAPAMTAEHEQKICERLIIRGDHTSFNC